MRHAEFFGRAGEFSRRATVSNTRSAFRGKRRDSFIDKLSLSWSTVFELEFPGNRAHSSAHPKQTLFIDVGQFMPAANTQVMSLKPSPTEAVRRRFGQFFRGLLRLNTLHAPSLPEDLHGDVGLGEELPANRAEAFWNSRRRSGARDLPI
ncbi:hypothetical protein [Rhizobium terrae]|uniref:hypothetical protein n=1 Tax=Rhizobium terrae TaxID=2171756 RepID=UPI0013C33292|nr:hypothetical protein [Rhizobium terrae]